MKVNKKKFLISILAISTVAISSSAVIGLASTSQTKDNTNDVTSDSVNTYTSVPMPGPTLDDPIVNSGGGNNGSGITTKYEIDWNNRDLSKNVFFEGDFAYTNSSKVTLLGMDPSTTKANVELPRSVKEISGYTKVTNEKSIKKFVGAFEDITTIKEVTIDGLNVKIEANAFKGCKGLEIVNMTNNAVRSIGKSAFEDCVNLKSISLSLSLNILEANVFKNTSSLTQITLPSSLRSIGDSAFENSGLTNLDMGSTGVSSIGKNAFKNAKSMIGVRFSSSLKGIGSSAFESTNINKVVITSKSLSTIGESAFKNCTNLTEFRLTARKCLLNVIPESIFENCSNLRTIEFTSSSGITSFKTIDKNAFKGTKISTFNIANVRTINESAFEECELLTTLTGQNSLQTIANYAFKNSALNVITSVRSTQNKSGTTDLSSIVSIGVGAFYGTKITAFKSGAYLTTIGDDSFKHIDTLKSVDFTSSKGLTKNENAFDEKDRSKVTWPASRVFRGNKIIF